MKNKIQPCGSVITSYSIHYTKLYEFWIGFALLSAFIFSSPNSSDFNRSNKPKLSFSQPTSGKVPLKIKLSSPETKPRIDLSGANTPMGQLDVGMRVEHERFGIGVVEAIDGVAPNQKATVQFVNAGSKQLLLKFAKLNILP